jgi:hypothetical protein
MRLKEIRLGHFAKISLFGLKTSHIKGKTGKPNTNPHFPLILTRGKYLETQVTVRKHPVSIALSNRVLEKIDQEAETEKIKKRICGITF